MSKYDYRPTLDYCNQHKLNSYHIGFAYSFCHKYPSKYHATVWGYLFDAAFYYHKPRPPSTPKQQRIQKLWQQLGTLSMI